MKRPNADPKNVDERLELLFRHAGLSDKQAKLYRLLLTVGEERVSVLSRKSGIKRCNTYTLLSDMKARGLVTEFEKENVRFFRPERPEKLESIITARQRECMIATSLAKDLMPDLSTQWKEAVNKPTIRYYQGREGVQTVLEDIYSQGKSEIVGCVGLEKPDEQLFGEIIHTFMPLRIRRKIFTRALNNDSERARELQKNASDRLSDIFLADGTHYPLPAEIDVYEDKIAFLSFAKKDFMGLIVENKDFAVTLKSVFTLLFSLLQQQQEKPKSALGPTIPPPSVHQA